MIQESVFLNAKDGQKIEIRTPREEEAQLSLDMMIEVAAHSPYILSTPESFKKKTIENQVKWFKEAAESNDEIILAIYHNNRMIGLCNGRSYRDVKRKHRAGLGISLLPDFRGKGIGYQMMEFLLQKMRQFPDIQIIELDVMTNNTPAVQMYEKLGFKKAGLFPKAFVLPSGEVSDNLTMYMEL